MNKNSTRAQGHRPITPASNLPVLPPPLKQPFVINWHCLQPCNFRCDYCFAEWQEYANGRPAHKLHEGSKDEVYRSLNKTSKFLEEIKKLPEIVPPPSGQAWGKPRLNIAGGEPLLLYEKNGKGPLNHVLEHAHKLGFELSIISNGYLMTDEFIKRWAGRLVMVGISMDSDSADTQRKIGRSTKRGETISAERIAEIFKQFRELNPRIKCKLNTVVNRLNCNEDMSRAVRKIAPDKWKIFQLLPLADTEDRAERQRKLAIAPKDFRQFCLNQKKNLSGGTVEIRTEDNDQMIGSYVMANPEGQLYLGVPTEEKGTFRHECSSPVHEVGAKEAYDRIAHLFNPDKFSSRYSPESPSIISVGGVHGVGKSFLCKPLEQLFPNVKHLETSALIKKGFFASEIPYKSKHLVAGEADKTISSADDLKLNQQMFLQTLRKTIAPGKNYLLGGHFVLAKENGEFIDVPEETFQQTDPVAIVVLWEDPKTIMERASGKEGLQKLYGDAICGDAGWWHEFQEREKQRARDIAKKLAVDYFEIKASNVKGFRKAVKDIFGHFKK